MYATDAPQMLASSIAEIKAARSFLYDEPSPVINLKVRIVHNAAGAGRVEGGCDTTCCGGLLQVALVASLCCFAIVGAAPAAAGMYEGDVT